MQLKGILHAILLSNPAHVPVKINKTNLSNGFYRVDSNIDNIPNLGVVFPTKLGANPMSILPLVLPMGWKDNPPAFSTDTKPFAASPTNGSTAPTTPPLITTLPS